MQLQIRLAGEQASILDLGTASSGAFGQDGEPIRFDVPAGQNAYLSSGGHCSFSRPPTQVPFNLPADAELVLTGTAEVTAEAGDVRLWVIEYGGGQRLGHQVVSLTGGPFRARWRTSPQCDAWCLALRFTGRGQLRVSELALAVDQPGAADSAGVRTASRKTIPAVVPDMWYRAGGGRESSSAIRSSSESRCLTRKAVEAQIRVRADHHLAQTHLIVDCYRIRQRLAVPLPVCRIEPLEMYVRTIQAYPWSVWMTWALEERINSLAWAAEWFDDKAAREAVLRDLSSLADWPVYRQRPDLDLTMSHAARIMWTAVNYWRWIGAELEGRFRQAAERIVEDGLTLCDRQFADCYGKADILKLAQPGRVLHNTPLVGALATALAMSLVEHPRATALQKLVAGLVEAFLDLREQGYSEGVTYDGYVLDFIACWLETVSAEQKAAILGHRQVQRILDEAYMLGAPGNAMQVAELGDVEPEQMPFHLSAQARLAAVRPHPVRSWFLSRCEPTWIRADALGLLREVADADAGDVPPAGALDAHCGVVLRSGWDADDLAVAVAASNSPMGHVHCDNGSMVVGCGGRWPIADAGYQQYMRTSEREFTLGVTAHNAPVINSEAQTRKDSRRICLKALGPDVFGATLDVTKCYPAGLKLDSVVRSVWLAGRDTVVVADQVLGSEVRSIEYHWHGHPEAAWWVADGWAQLHLAGTTLWIGSPQSRVAGPEVRRLAGSRGQVTLAVEADIDAAAIWWVFVRGVARPTVEVCDEGLSIRVNGSTFGFAAATDGKEAAR